MKSKRSQQNQKQEQNQKQVEKQKDKKELETIIENFQKKNNISNEVVLFINNIINYILMINNPNFDPDDLRKVYKDILDSLEKSITAINESNVFKIKKDFF